MDNVRKAFVMLSAAVTMTALGTSAVEAGAPPPSKGKRVDKNKAKSKAKSKKRVKRGKRRRPADFDPDLSMPAGTAYDVISRHDLP